MTARVPWSEYAALAAVNWSTLREIRQSPLHYRHRLLNPKPDTKATVLGRAVHAAVFERFRFLEECVVYEGRRAGKAWEAFRDEHEAAGQTVLYPNQYELALEIADAVGRCAAAAPYLAAGSGEHTVRWTDPHTGLACKGRLDWLTDVDGRRYVLDLKTTKCADLGRFARDVANYGYHGQAAFYADGVTVAEGVAVEKVGLIAVESDPPHDCALFWLDPDALYAGTEEYEGYMRKVAECMAADAWPGRYTEPQTLRLPAWVYHEETDENMAGLGLTIEGEDI